MTPTKYEELCTALDQMETIKADFKKSFSAKFAVFAGCPENCITIEINETANPLTFKAEMTFKISTEQNEMSIKVDGLKFVYHQDKAPNYQQCIAFKGSEYYLGQNVTNLFFSILKELQRPLVVGED